MIKKIYYSFLVSIAFLTTSCGLNGSLGNGVPFGWECRNVESRIVRTGNLEKEYMECRKERGEPWLIAGKFKTYYDGYDLKQEANYKINKINESKFISVLDGEVKHFYPDGQLSAEGQYINDRQTGLWKKWHNNGQLHYQTTRY